MFEHVTEKKRSRWRTFWPEVADIGGADEAIRLGYWTCSLVAGLTAVVALFGQTWSGLVDALVFALLGLGLKRKWRSAAVAASLLFALNVVISLSRSPLVGVLTVIFFVCLLSGVRGTFAHRRLIAQGLQPGSGVPVNLEAAKQDGDGAG